MRQPHGPLFENSRAVESCLNAASQPATSGNDLTPLFVAAALTFIVLALINTIVAPWVQAKTRQRERWEEAVSELASLLEEQLPRAMSELQSAVHMERLYHSMKDDPQFDEERVNEGLRAATRERRQVDEIVGQHLQRTRLLTTRVVRRRRNAPYWQKFKGRQVVLDVYAGTIGFHGSAARESHMNDEEWDAQRREKWNEYEKAREKFVELVDELESSMKPPPRQLFKRARERARSTRKKVKEWRERRGATSRQADGEESVKSG